MNIAIALKTAEKQLQEAGIETYALDASLLLSGVLGENRLNLLLQKERELGAEHLEIFQSRVNRRKNREPLQYIEGQTEFMGLPFLVSPDVLIPRQDTEILVETAIERIPSGASVLDIGTGSGAIAVSLKKLRPDLRVTAEDISAPALAVAQNNAAKNQVTIDFLLGNCLESLTDLRYDCIISNPPYISETERASLSPEVCCEPTLALFDGSDGLSFYRRICRDAPDHLNAGGLVLFEIGYRQKDDVGMLLQKHIGAPFFKRDYGNQWRVAGARLS